jgi:hypothetical protein
MKFLPGRRIAALAIVATFTAVLAMLACTHAESPDPEAAQHIASTPSPSVTATAREGDLAQSSTEPRADVQVAPEGQGDRRGVAQESLRLSGRLSLDELRSDHGRRSSPRNRRSSRKWPLAPRRENRDQR